MSVFKELENRLVHTSLTSRASKAKMMSKRWF